MGLEETDETPATDDEWSPEESDSSDGASPEESDSSDGALEESGREQRGRERGRGRGRGSGRDREGGNDESRGRGRGRGRGVRRGGACVSANNTTSGQRLVYNTCSILNSASANTYMIY